MTKGLEKFLKLCKSWQLVTLFKWGRGLGKYVKSWAWSKYFYEPHPKYCNDFSVVDKKDWGRSRNVDKGNFFGRCQS